MIHEQAIYTPLDALEGDTGHLAGTVSPQDAYRFELGMQQLPEQQQRQAIGGTARLGMYLDNGPVAFAPFTPHGYHTPRSVRRQDRHIL